MSTITMIERVIIDVEARKVTRLKMGQDQHRSTLCDDVKCGGEWVDVQWNPDGSQVAFVSTSRNHQQANLRVADAATGAIREVLEEKGETFLESGNGRVNWRYLPGSNEAIWFSQRDNWGQLYLHDLQTGKQKSQITSGDGNVTQLMRVDEADAHALFPGRRQGARARSVLPPLLPADDGRQAGAAADAGRCRPRDLAVAVGQVLRRQLLEARYADRPRCCATTPARWCCRSRRWTSPG